MGGPWGKGEAGLLGERTLHSGQKPGWIGSSPDPGEACWGMAGGAAAGSCGEAVGELGVWLGEAAAL